MSYTRPLFDAADATWQGASPYTRPAADAADATWQPAGPATVEALVTVPSPLGAPAGLVGVVAPEAVECVAVVPSPLGAPAARAQWVGQGGAAVPSPLGAPTVRALAVPVALSAVPSPLGIPACVATVLRYELRGQVRDQGVLVDRRVRAYRRDTGALMAEADTTAGAFRLPVGFEAREFYLVPVDLDSEATDYAPPCANRVESVLALDEVAA